MNVKNLLQKGAKEKNKAINPPQPPLPLMAAPDSFLNSHIFAFHICNYVDITSMNPKK